LINIDAQIRAFKNRPSAILPTAILPTTALVEMRYCRSLVQS
jgi:hypothetical protein